jgi:hypothetical protein
MFEVTDSILVKDDPRHRQSSRQLPTGPKSEQLTSKRVPMTAVRVSKNACLLLMEPSWSLVLPTPSDVALASKIHNSADLDTDNRVSGTPRNRPPKVPR